MKNTSAIIFAVLLLAILPCTAKANLVSTVEIWNASPGASKPVAVWGGGREGVEVYAGAYMFKGADGSGGGKIWSSGTMSGFCVELEEPAPEILSRYSVIPLEKGPLSGPMGTAKAEYISELWGRFYEPSWASGGAYSGKQNVRAAAFAAAIWEILYEDLPASRLKWNVRVDGTVGAGGFHTNFAGSGLANYWLHTLNGKGPMADLRILSHDGSQDYIVAVPEPTTVALLGFGSVLSLIRRRRRTT